MGISRRALAAVATLILGTFAVTSAFAVEVTRYRSKDLMASAEWSEGGGEECVSTNVSLYVSEMTTTSEKPKTEETTLSINIWQYNWCTATTLRSIFASVPLESNQFTGTRALDYADLVADIVAHDSATDTDVPLHIDLFWEGEGDTFRGMYMNKSWSRTYRFEQRGRGANRMAVVSGIVSDGVTNYAAENSSYSSGQLFWNADSYLSVVSSSN